MLFFFQINDQSLDHLESLNDALKLLNVPRPILSVTLAKSCNAINNMIAGKYFLISRFL